LSTKKAKSARTILFSPKSFGDQAGDVNCAPGTKIKVINIVWERELGMDVLVENPRNMQLTFDLPLLAVPFMEDGIQFPASDQPSEYVVNICHFGSTLSRGKGVEEFL
jgi:hypothetical protein